MAKQGQKLKTFNYIMPQNLISPSVKLHKIISHRQENNHLVSGFHIIDHI